MKAQKTALVIGVSGQDGSLLARCLLTKGYRVVGTSRSADAAALGNLRRLCIHQRVQIEQLQTSNYAEIEALIGRVRPCEIYNLSGQSSAVRSFEIPVETFDSLATACVRVLEAVQTVDPSIRFYNAGSSECFGDTGNSPATEDTGFQPRNPYAAAKAAAFFHVKNCRERQGLYACTGIMFSHESPLRAPNFLSRKVSCAVRAISRGQQDSLELGDLSAERDWGWAPEYVEAMWLMLQQDQAEDFVIATGESHTIKEFIEEAFRCADLDWRKYVLKNSELRRPADIAQCRADPARIRRQLGWSAKSRLREIIRRLLDDEV